MSATLIERMERVIASELGPTPTGQQGHAQQVRWEEGKRGITRHRNKYLYRKTRQTRVEWT